MSDGLVPKAAPWGLAPMPADADAVASAPPLAKEDVTVAVAPASATDDARLCWQMAALINKVYTEAGAYLRPQLPAHERGRGQVPDPAGQPGPGVPAPRRLRSCLDGPEPRRHWMSLHQEAFADAGRLRHAAPRRKVPGGAGWAAAWCASPRATAVDWAAWAARPRSWSYWCQRHFGTL
ncbi:hypothetical protein CDD83_8836 [Cordyceps sp. RAO-2017]|nr:hypothetical protein CDD83_8836 [Cordyceps sp. RAO-2017]